MPKDLPNERAFVGAVPSRPRSDEGTTSHENLRREAEELRQKSLKLRQQIAALGAGKLEDKRFRLAALNLMEDAEEARRRTEAMAEDRERAERALQESEEQFRRAIEEAPIPVIMHAEDGQVLQISRTWTELTGFHLEDMKTFEGWLNRAYGSGAEAVRDRMRNVFKNEAGHSEQIDFTIRTRGGQMRYWVFTTSAPGLLRDGRRFAVGMALDITERKRAEEALARSEERLRLVVENARDFAIFSTDLERRVTTWNVGAEQILGYTAEEIIGQSADIIFVEEDRLRGACEREAETALREGRAADERWHLRKDGSRFWGRGVMMPMQGPANAKVGFVKVFRDDTESKRKEEALAASRIELERAFAQAQRAREEAENANRTKDTFLATLSHELRTPLMPVLMTAESLLKTHDLPERVRRGLEMVSRNVQLETHFINDLLDLTRISRGKYELSRDAVDLHAALQAAIEICEPEIRSKDQKVSVSLRATETRVLGDSPRLQQAFWNIIKNASKFTPKEGQIRISSRNVGQAVEVEVTDTGIGLPPEQLKSIFEAFHQGSSNISRTYGGLGLGLTIAKATIEQLGGTIWAESHGPGQGSVFVIQLPLSSASSGSQPASPAKSAD